MALPRCDDGLLQVLVDRLRHLKHIQLLAAKNWLQLINAMISRLFCGFLSLWFLMCAQTFFVTSLRGSGSLPTIFASCSEGLIGFINPLFVFGFACCFGHLYS